MQTQDASAEEMLFKLWPWLEANKNRIIAVTIAILVVVGIYYYVTTQREQKEINAGEALTQLLLTTPGSPSQSAGELAKLADQYNGTEAAKRAILQGAAQLFMAGSYADAQAQFQKFLAGTSSGPLAATAQLGIAECLEAQGKTDDALAAYKHTSAAFPSTASELTSDVAAGRIEESEGKFTEAMNDYQNAVRAGRMGGSQAETAYERATALKAVLQARQPASATTTPAATATPAPAATKPATPTLLIPAK